MVCSANLCLTAVLVVAGCCVDLPCSFSFVFAWWCCLLVVAGSVSCFLVLLLFSSSAAVLSCCMWCFMAARIVYCVALSVV